MLHIERLRMKLPAGYEHRAGAIAMRVGELLADIDTDGFVSMSELKLPNIRVSEPAGDDDVARAVADGIRTAMDNRRGYEK